MIDQQIPAAQLEPIGRAGRRLLRLGLETQQNSRFYLPVAVPAVCQTYALAPAESEDLIRRLVQPERLAQGSIEGLYWLARSIKALIPVAPTLVADIYRTIFDAPDMPDKKVPLNDSQILPLATTLRQNFDGAKRELVAAFGDFLVVAPDDALRVLAHVVEGYIKNKPGHEEEPRVFEIPFGDHVAHFAPDASCIWDGGSTYEYDPAVMMLKAFQRHLGAVASTDDAPARLSALLGHIVSRHRRAVVWRRLLMSAAEHPVTLGRLLTPLLKAPIILIAPDTYTAAGELLRNVYSHLAEEERRRIEEVIMGLPDNALLQDDPRREQKRARLLGCLPLDYVASAPARELIAHLRAENAVPANEPAFKLEWSDADADDTEEMMWREEGIPFDSPENLAFRTLLAPVSDFCRRFRDGEPPIAEAQEDLPRIQRLQSAISAGPANGVHERFLESGVVAVVSAYERCARNLALVVDPQAREIITGALLDASTHPIPRYSDESNARFDDTPSWGEASPRLAAAQGLMWLARVPEAATSAVMDAIDRLSKDRTNVVRFMVVEKLRCLYRSRFDDMWRYIETTAKGDQSKAVLVALINYTLRPLMGRHMDRVVSLTRGIFERVGVSEEGRDPRGASLSLLVKAYLYAGQAEAAHFLLFTLAEDIARHAREADAVTPMLRSTLTLGSVGASRPEEEAQRERAWQLFNRICQAARARWDDLSREYGAVPTAEIPAEVTALVQALAKLLDGAASQLYFAAQCYEEKKATRGEDADRLPAETRQRFWQECQPALDSLEPIGMARGAHRLIELLESFIEVAPEQVFIRLGRIVVAAEEGRYHHEALAADLIVRIVERYLAQYRQIFQANAECRRLLVRVLDIFVGWPRAARLAYRLEELYR